jgi:hypothetical protein
LSVNAVLASLLLSLGVIPPAASGINSLDRLQDSQQSSSASGLRQAMVAGVSTTSTADDNPDDALLAVIRPLTPEFINQSLTASPGAAELCPHLSAYHPRAPPQA